MPCSAGNKNITTKLRFCGKVLCDPSKYCNKLGDGYVLFGIFSLCIGILYYVLFWFVIAKRVDKPKEAYEPHNVTESIKCCPRTCCGEDIYVDQLREELLEDSDGGDARGSYLEML